MLMHLVVKSKTCGFNGGKSPPPLVSSVKEMSEYKYKYPLLYFLCLLYSALIGDSHVMGWGSKAIEIRAVENGQLDGVFMHKRTQKLRFLCERNDKVSQVLETL